MQAEWKEFIHKNLDLRKALSSEHVTLVNWVEGSFKVHTLIQRKTMQKL